jgi:hypothetical protein
VIISQFPSIIAGLLHAKLKDGMKSEEQSTTQIMELLQLARTLPLTTDRPKIPLGKISFIYVFSMDIPFCNAIADCKMRMSRARHPNTSGIFKEIKEHPLSASYVSAAKPLPPNPRFCRKISCSSTSLCFCHSSSDYLPPWPLR